MVFFEHKYIDNDEKSVVFSAVENTVLLGKCILCINKEIAEITEVKYSDGNEYIVEGLIKSAFNFAANRNFYIGRCSAENIDFCLKRMNLIKYDGYYENDIPSILTGSCKGCSK